MTTLNPGQATSPVSLEAPREEGTRACHCWCAVVEMMKVQGRDEIVRLWWRLGFPSDSSRTHCDGLTATQRAPVVLRTVPPHVNQALSATEPPGSEFTANQRRHTDVPSYLLSTLWWTSVCVEMRGSTPYWQASAAAVVVDHSYLDFDPSTTMTRRYNTCRPTGTSVDNDAVNSHLHEQFSFCSFS